MFDWNQAPQTRRRPREGFRAMSDVSLANRIECRHLVRQARARIDVGFENDLLVDTLNADGAIEDCESAIADLRAIQKLLGKQE